MKTIEELKAELKKYEDIRSEYTIKIQNIEKEILGRTEVETNNYIGKYLRAFKRYEDGLDYSKYLYVTGAEKNFDGTDWSLSGIGFTSYISDEIKRQIFRTDSNYINLSDVENGYYELEELTKEQFYEARNKSLKNIMEEEYE